MLSQPDSTGRRRFLVTWRDGQQPPRIHPVGCLSAGDDYAFSYLPGAWSVPGFRPLPGLPVGEGPRRSTRLFLFFADRLMDPRRPDFPDYVRALDLPDDPDQLDLLARSEGVLKGDRLAVVEEPHVDPDGRVAHVFVVRGLRFALEEPAAREAVLADLTPGVRLHVRTDHQNPVNDQALQLSTPGGTAVGWVPDALVPFVAAVIRDGEGQVHVQRSNGKDVPPHLRLLARVIGRHPPGEPALPQLADVPDLAPA